MYLSTWEICSYVHTTFHIPSCQWLLPSIKIRVCHNKFSYFQETGQQQNLLLGEYDVCLSNVDVVYQLVGEKKRRLAPGSNVSGKVNGLHILCKVIIFFLTPWCMAILQKLTVAQLCKFSTFIKPSGMLLCPQEPITGPYLEPNEWSS